MRITSKGQVTIPLEVRERFGLLPNSEVEFVVEGNTVRLVKAKSKVRGQAITDRLRRGATSVSMSTDEIMKLTRR